MNQANIVKLNLRSINNLTISEKSFLLGIAPHVESESNCIVEDCRKSHSEPLNETDIAKVLGEKKQNVNTIIKKLIDKGILVRVECGLESDNARAFILFVNPNIMFSGDRDNVDETLKVMFRKASLN